MRQYKIGDEVWYAYYEMRGVKKPCPVCFRNKQVALTLGNGQQVTLPCDFCGHGVDEPSGEITEYEYVAQAKLITITHIESRIDQVSEERRYYYGTRTYADIKDIFDTEAEALAKCQAKIDKKKIEEDTLTEHLKFNQYKSFAWNAGYHLRAARTHRKDAEYHERKAVLCKEKAK